MYTWYHDTNNVQKLLAWKRERDGKYSDFYWKEFKLSIKFDSPRSRFLSLNY